MGPISQSILNVNKPAGDPKKNSSSQKLGVKNNSRKKIFIVQRSLHMEPIFQQCPQCYRGDRVLKEKTE
jgi:hypothetical protein